MPQELHLGGGRYFTGILRVFKDGGTPAKRAMVAGEVVTLAEAKRALPTIVQAQQGWFYEDGQPVTEPAHVEHLVPPFRAQALQWIKTKGGTAKPMAAKKRARPAPAGEVRAEAPETADTGGRRGGSRREIKIDGPAAYARHGGVEVTGAEPDDPE